MAQIQYSSVAKFNLYNPCVDLELGKIRELELVDWEYPESRFFIPYSIILNGERVYSKHPTNLSELSNDHPSETEINQIINVVNRAIGKI